MIILDDYINYTRFRTLYVEVYRLSIREVTNKSQRFRTLYVEVYQQSEQKTRMNSIKFPYIIC